MLKSTIEHGVVKLSHKLLTYQFETTIWIEFKFLTCLFYVYVIFFAATCLFIGRKIADASSQQIEERLELAIIETGEAEMIATEAERKYSKTVKI